MDDVRFAVLDHATRVWAVGAVHGQAAKLRALHQKLARHFAPGDRLVYLGNVLGVGDRIIETVDEILSMRRRMLARLAGSLEACDIVFLRGAQEEMWSKLLQLQFATNPSEILEWLIDHGVGPNIVAYGSTLDAARAQCRDGTVAIAKWTNGLRAAIHRTPGHYQWLTGLKRAALTADGGLLLVHASVDPSRPLTMQGDTFWWDSGAFDRLARPFENFARVIRGYDHRHRGLDLARPFAATVDGGCGYGGTLAAVCFAPDGTVLDRIEV
ncbi:MAG: hypothetical protein D6763_07515 [Alphaproteobacteria bacterium]|nr:MAG: hypothetical protein D6763_07515 [Alphaproteobacteria bacterium]